MSRHNKGKGFSQTSKRFDGDLKAQHQAARNKQADHSADVHAEEAPASTSGSEKAPQSKRPR